MMIERIKKATTRKEKIKRISLQINKIIRFSDKIDLSKIEILFLLSFVTCLIYTNYLERNRRL